MQYKLMSMLLVLTIVSIVDTGYIPSQLDDEGSAYPAIIKLKKDSSLYSKDFYVNSTKELPIYFYDIFSFVYTQDIELPKSDWNEVIKFSKTTHKDSLFIIPAINTKHDYSNFRFLSERSVFIT